MRPTDLRVPKQRPLPFTCPVCVGFCPGYEAVYDPRASRRSTRLVCRACALWLLSLHPSWEREPGGKPAWEQLTFPSLDGPLSGETDSPADTQKAG
jgi:hypothetical protein